MDKTQSWLAEKLHTKQPYISRIVAEGGTNITVDTAGELEAALGVPILQTPPEFEFRAIYDDQYWAELSAKRFYRRNQYGIPLPGLLIGMQVNFDLKIHAQSVSEIEGVNSDTLFQSEAFALGPRSALDNLTTTFISGILDARERVRAGVQLS